MVNVDLMLNSLREVGETVFLVLAGTVLLELVLYIVLVRGLRSKLAIPYMLLAPAVVGLLGLVLYPILWELNVSFTKMSLNNFRIPGFLGLNNNMYVGLDQYVKVFTKPVLKQVYFGQLLGQTVLWTLVNVTFHVLGGLGLALLMNRNMRGRGIYRALIILPWAIPNIVAVLTWRTEFHYEFGFVNQLIKLVGLEPVRWLSDPLWNFVAMCITNIWLGIPFMMVIILGGLQSIAGEYYEAAEMDGATTLQQFRNITIPLLQPVLAPAIVLGTVWTFNNFNVPFFINQNELETSDILVTALFRAAFQYNLYGFAAAFAFIIFLMLLVFCVFYIRWTGALKGATE